MFDPMPVADRIAIALKGTPMLLTMLLINLAVLAMVTYLTVQSATLRFQERAELVKALQECLARCQPMTKEEFFATVTPALLSFLSVAVPAILSYIAYIVQSWVAKAGRRGTARRSTRRSRPARMRPRRSWARCRYQDKVAYAIDYARESVPDAIAQPDSIG